jgi:hypothetical protein
MTLPPGITYILHLLFQLVLHMVASYTLLELLVHKFGLPLPQPVEILICLVSKPLLLYATVVATYIRSKYRAARLGATLAPQVQESSFKIIRKVKTILKSYPGWSISFYHMAR